MDIRSKLDKVRALGAAGTVKMAAVKWKKMERGLGMAVAPARKLILGKILAGDNDRFIIFENHYTIKGR